MVKLTQKQSILGVNMNSKDPYDMSDIMLGNDPKTNQATNIKKVLVAISVLVIVFLIVLIVMRLINKGNIDTNPNITMPSETEILKEPQTPKAPEIVAEPVNSTPPSKVENKPAESKIVEIKSNEPSNVEIKEPVKTEPVVIKEEPVEIKSIAVAEPNNEILKEPTFEPKQVEKVAETKKTEIQNDIKADNKKTKAETKKIAEKAVKKEPSVFDNTSANKAKKETKTEAKKATQTQKIATQKAEAKKIATAKSGTYIQVLAFSADKPDAKYIKKLQDSGYSYKFREINVNGKKMTKILVGPYSSNDLNNALSKIRSNINPQAFIYRVK